MIVVIPLRRPPEAARSWLLLVMFLPLPALLLYRMIGRARFPKWRHQRFLTSAALREHVARTMLSATSPSQLSRLARHLGGFPACGGNGLSFQTDYADIVAAMVKAIDGAVSSVHLQTYIFADDHTGSLFIDALGRAAARGVDARVLVDALGSRPWSKRSMAKLHAVGVDARLTLPIGFRLRRLRRDLRNHRKLCLIDGCTGFIGSLNIVDRDFKAGIVNDELVARVDGPVVAALEATFLTDWYLETAQLLDRPIMPPACGALMLQPMPSSPDHPLLGYERLLVEIIHVARYEVTIVTPYFIPDDALMVALKNAVDRGVSVNIIVSRVVDQYLVRLAQRSFYDELLHAGIQLFRYRDHLLHTKSVSVDGHIGLVGSSNADIRSFMLNAEINLLIHDPVATEKLERIHHGYSHASDLLTLAEWRMRPRPIRLLENLARLMTPLL
ncbi:phospholipase D-like domain-containing protein [Sphingobium sp.]|uniref:phospholipase D-like domain-containing protein n=1 Tax=Sphingobium sp. TaxID=1912891 RepID=UPI003BB78EA5